MLCLILPVLINLLVTSATAQYIDNSIKTPEGYKVEVVPGFRIHFQPSDEKAALKLSKVAGKMRKEIAGDLGLYHPKPIDVFLASSSEEYQRLQPDGGTRPEWSVGVAHTNQRVIILYSPAGTIRAGKRSNFNQVFIHELVHIYLHESLNDAPIPKWLHEGYARFSAREMSLTLAMKISWAYLFDRLIPLNELMHRFPQEENNAGLAYAQSQSFIGFLIQEYGRLGFQTFLARLRAGRTVDEALTLTTKMNLVELEDEWLTYLALHYTILRILADSTTLWAVASLLIVFGFLRVRRRKKLRLAQMEIEEKAIYGDRINYPTSKPDFFRFFNKIRPKKEDKKGGPPYLN